MPIADVGFVDVSGYPASDALEDHGPTLLVQIGFDAAFDHTLPGATPQLAAQPVPALLDTGASQSCMDIGLAARLRLPVIDKGNVAGVGGAVEVPVYLAQIFVPMLGFTQYGRFAGVHLSSGGQLHQALIGRSFLRRMIMTYDGRTGKVSVAL